MSSFIESFTTTRSDLERIGGKGRSLTHLVKHAFNVPPGFHVTTSAYRQFIKDNGLHAAIVAAAVPTLKGGQPSFEDASAKIQSLFDDASLSSSIVDAVCSEYVKLPGHPCPVAVRSSATAEDLPNLSFAGQQETYLNIRGNEEVVHAVKQCWASLWTPQAMNYRHQHGIDQDTVAMAVVIQTLVPAEIAGILFTANPATGERSEMIVNASYGLGEAVVSGQVSPDTYVIERKDGSVKESLIGTKELQIALHDKQGTCARDVPSEQASKAVLTEIQISQLWETAESVLTIYDGIPQDIEWAICEDELHLLQARPITNLPVQPIEVEWQVPAPAKYVSRRQIVENMPDPICPLFEELYLTEGLESSRKDQSLMVGGGPMFITVNGYAYQRFDFHMVHEQAKEKGLLPVDDAEIDAAELAAKKTLANQQAHKNKETAAEAARRSEEARNRDRATRERDLVLFWEDLSDADRVTFKEWSASQEQDGFARTLTMPASKNPTYTAFNSSDWNDRQLGEWFKVTRPRLQRVRDKFAAIEINSATDQELLEAIREMGIEEGYYWSSNASHTFGVSKSTDDQLQCFLRETLPHHHFISGQFLSGFESRTMQANADLFEIAKLIRKDKDLAFLTLTTPLHSLFEALCGQATSIELTALIDSYMKTYGHQGYSMDFVEPIQAEEPAAMMATLRSMVADANYDPRAQEERARRTREEKFEEIGELLEGMEYWQFRFRLWLAGKYHYIREEVAFMFGYTWGVLRPMAAELGKRLTDIGTLTSPDHLYFLECQEIEQAIGKRAEGIAIPELGTLAASRLELREARKKHHPPGTLPTEASQIDGIAFKETQIKNDPNSAVMHGFPVSSGQVTAAASVVTSAAEFEKMAPGSILVSPLTTPAWTQLFAHAAGLVTDVGSILAHGSIVAREYGIPAVLGVGNGTKRITHGQMIRIDGDRGTVEILDS